MQQQQVIDILKEAGAFLEGHFLLTSGRHSDRYLQCAKVFQDAKYAEMLCRLLVDQLQKLQIDVVVGPAIGAINMAYEVSRQLQCQNYFAERADGVVVLRRGFEIAAGMRVLVVEDVCTTGGTVREVMGVVEQAGGVPVAVGVLVDRTGGQLDFGVPFLSVLSMEVPSYEASECPICESGIPLVKPGSRITKP